MESLGQFLKREREFRRVTLNQVVEATRIRGDRLEALETDRLASLGKPIYVKGMLRAYARYLQLDFDEVLHRYEAAPAAGKRAAGGLRRNGAWRSWAAALAILVALAAGAALLARFCGSVPPPPSPLGPRP